MKRIFYNLFLLIFLLIGFSCSKKNTSNIDASLVQQINVTQNNFEPLPWDSLIAEIKLLPLQTSANCLIGSVSRIVYFRNRFFIYDRVNSAIFVFDNSGNFIFKIDKKGKGNGEYIELRDFRIDDEGKIYILGFNKILKFSSKGTYLSTIPINNLKGETKSDYINPLQFAIGSENEFFLYNGSMGIKHNLEKQYVLYKINSNSQLIGRYLPINNHIMVFPNNLYYYKNGYHIQPMLGNDTIYSLTEGEIIASYYIDFGKKKITKQHIEIPINSRKLVPYILKLSQAKDFCLGINNIIETDEYFYFNFRKKGTQHYLFFSKKTNKKFVGKQHITKELRPSSFKCVTDDNFFVSVIETDVLKGAEKRINIEDYQSFNSKDKEIFDIIEKIEITDNPALLLIRMKPF